MKLVDVLRKECVQANPAFNNKEEVLQAAARLAKKSPILSEVNEQSIFEGLRKREALGSTGFGKGIAIPHCRLKSVPDFVVGIITVTGGVDFEALDDEKVKLIVFIVGPEGNASRHIKLLSAISQTLLTPGVIKEVLDQRTPDGIYESFLRHTVPEVGIDEEPGNSLLHVFIQDEDVFREVLQLLAAVGDSSLMVVDACKEQKWHYIGVGKSNRWFTVGSGRRKLSKYGRNVLRNNGRWCNITGLRKSGKYRLAERVGSLNKLGTVKIVFSRRRGESKHIALVTDDLKASMRTIVTDYLKRWSIEMLIKDEKQHLGLGDYRVRRYQAVVRHLQLVDTAYACLTHVGVKAYRAQGQNKTKKVLRLEPISKLKERMCRIVWQENVQDVIKYSHEKPVIRRLEKLLAA